MSNVSLTRNIREIKDGLGEEHKERMELEKKNWQLELALNNIKEALEEVGGKKLWKGEGGKKRKKRERVLEGEGNPNIFNLTDHNHNNGIIIIIIIIIILNRNPKKWNKFKKVYSWKCLQGRVLRLS